MPEIFREVTPSDYVNVLKALEEDWPKHFILQQLLTVFEDYRKHGCKWKHSLYLYGDYNCGVYLNKITIELPDRDVINLYVDTTSPNVSILKEALMETKLIPWEKKNYCFSHINAKFSGIIQSVFSAQKIFCEVSPNTLFWLPPNKDFKVQPLPEDSVVEVLDKSFAQEMDKTWPHRSPGSDLILEEHLERNFGLGLFRKSDKKLMCSALSNQTGGIFVLFCAPEFRGRGYATVLVQRMVLKIRQRGRIPFATIILGNKPSEQVFKKSGFEAFCDADYLIARG